MTPEEIPDRIQFVSIDVSFISLTKVLGPVKALMEPDGEVVCLIKPQFEAGREKVGKKGVVREKSVHLEVIEDGRLLCGQHRFGPSIWNSPRSKGRRKYQYLLHLETARMAAPSQTTPSALKIVERHTRHWINKRHNRHNLGRNFYIVANPDKENTKNMQAAIEKYLKARGAGVSAGKSVSGHGNPYTDRRRYLGDTECVITLGGDGTLIRRRGILQGESSDDRYQPRRSRVSYPDRPGRRCEGASGCAFGGLLNQIQERMMLKGCVYRRKASERIVSR